jgi:protein MpaA
VVPTTTAAPAIPPIPPIVPIDPATIPADVEVEIGRSVNGVPITVVRRGDPDGTRVLAVGVIHGNEADGVAIIDRLRTDPVPDGVELWLVRSMNPDGQAIGDRQNAHLVDLNRNFPENWDVLGTPGDWQYGGVGPASEPETQAMVALGSGIRPDLVLWYHQDLFRIAPGTGRSGEIRSRYAAVAGLPIVGISGGTYTGTAAQWARTVIPDGGVGITVELGPTLSAAEVDAHIAAVDAIATEFF